MKYDSQYSFYITFLAECDPGYQLSSLGHCEPCPGGFYRARGMPSCEQCPAGLTTANVGASSRGHCNLGNLNDKLCYIFINFISIHF